MNYKEVIESKYNREAWQKLLYDIFRNKISFWNTPSAVHVSSRLAKEAIESWQNISCRWRIYSHIRSGIE